MCELLFLLCPFCSAHTLVPRRRYCNKRLIQVDCCKIDVKYNAIRGHGCFQSHGKKSDFMQLRVANAVGILSYPNEVALPARQFYVLDNV